MKHVRLLLPLLLPPLLLSTLAHADHGLSGARLWGYRNIGKLPADPAEVYEYDIGDDVFIEQCTPDPTDNGRGIASDPDDGTLWYTFVTSIDNDGDGYVDEWNGDGLIHRTTPPPDCEARADLEFGDGPLGTDQDDIGALDIDPDSGHIWAAGYKPLFGLSHLYLVDRASGAILKECTLPFQGVGAGNDTLAVATIEGLSIETPNGTLSGSGKYLLTDAGEGDTGAGFGKLYAVDAVLSFDPAEMGGPCLIMAEYDKVVRMTGIDFDFVANKLIAVDADTSDSKIYDLGPPPFDVVDAEMNYDPAFDPVTGDGLLEDITLAAPVVPRPPCDRPVDPDPPDDPCDCDDRTPLPDCFSCPEFFPWEPPPEIYLPAFDWDCCPPTGEPQPCWAYFGDPGLCDPRVGPLFGFWEGLEAAAAATTEAEQAQALGALLGLLDVAPAGPNVTEDLRDIAQREIQGAMPSRSMGFTDLTPANLVWSHRFFNGWDLDLRTDGLEVPTSVPAGQNVSVSLGGGIVVTFDHATAAGSVTPRFRQFGARLPAGYHGSVPFYNVDLDSTVGTATGSGITVTMNYGAAAFQPGALVRLFQKEGDTLVDRTLTTNPSQKQVVGHTTSLGRFILLGVGAVAGIQCPPDVTLECPADTSPGATGSASGNGTGGSITISHSDCSSLASDGTREIWRMWLAADGRTGKVCAQHIAVADTTAPLLTCPSTMDFDCPVGGQAFVTLPPATAVDACDPAPTIVNDHTQNGADASGYYPLGQTIVNCTATDLPGNASTCQVLVSVGDQDGDTDGHADICDCAPTAPGTWEAPLEVTGLVASRSTLGPAAVTLAWDSRAAQAGPAVVYDVISGSLAALRSSQSFAQYECLATDEIGTAIDKVQPQLEPPLPNGYWYLVRAQNLCGDGTWGDGSITPDPRDLLDTGGDCVASAPVLSVAMSDSPDPVAAGANLTYTLAYGNSGAAGATGVVITDAVPSNTTFVSASAGGVLLPGNVVSWNIGNVAAGANGTVQLVVRVTNPLTTGTSISNGSYAIDSDQTSPANGAPQMTFVVNLSILAIDMDISTPTVIDSIRTLGGPVGTLDVGVIVDARDAGGIRHVGRIAFGVINAFNTGGATVTGITPLAITDVIPPAINATFASLAGEFQFGVAIVEPASSSGVFSGGPLQYARFRISFSPGTLVPGSVVRVFVGDAGPGSGAARNGSNVDISGDFSADGTPVFGNPGSDQGSGAGIHYIDGELRF